jgi:hypothetical protein
MKSVKYGSKKMLVKSKILEKEIWKELVTRYKI